MTHPSGGYCYIHFTGGKADSSEPPAEECYSPQKASAESEDAKGLEEGMANQGHLPSNPLGSGVSLLPFRGSPGRRQDAAGSEEGISRG